jgi:hypothetical protein
MAEFILARRQAGRQRSPGLFETSVCNLLRETMRERGFFYFHASQPIEKARFGKINVSKRQDFYWRLLTFMAFYSLLFRLGLKPAVVRRRTYRRSASRFIEAAGFA